MNREIEARNTERDAAERKVAEIKRKNLEFQQRIQKEVEYEWEIER